MQPNAFIPEVPPPLAEPSILTRWLFEDPTWLLVALALLTLLSVTHAWRRDRRGLALGFAAIGGMLAAALWFTASLVVTSREQVVDRTWALIRTTAGGDAAALDGLLATKARLENPRSDLQMNRQLILDRIRATTGGSLRVREWAVIRMQAIADESGRAQSQFYLRIIPEATNAPMLSWWRVTWERPALASSDWKVTLIEPLSGTPAEVLR
ncbi:MAG: hypothetical protein SFY96_11530 [Planctomycetota bacterium]|nr:hypothetical protein [Planctomycetota bacterium]